jgi:hypothetical protein
MSRSQKNIAVLGMIVVLGFFIVVAIESCAPVSPDVYVDTDSAISINAVKRHIDEEYGIVCYLARDAISCLPIPERASIDW